jgi:hypothetical protein
VRPLALSLLIAFLACGGDDDGGSGDGVPAADAAASGRACASGLDPAAATALASPALDCPSTLCLHVEGEETDLCTEGCGDASDCVTATVSACDGDFACVAPMDTGPFACSKVCVCASAVPAGGFPVDCSASHGW